MPHLHPYPVYRFPDPQTSQVFFECFTFAGSEAKVCCQQGMLHLEWNGNVYKLTVGEYDAGVGRSQCVCG